MRFFLFMIFGMVAGSCLADSQLKAKDNYQRHCAACHGFDGMSVYTGAPNLRMNEGLLQSDFEIVQKLKAGSPKKPPMMGLLSDQELHQIVIYIRTIR